MRAQAPARESDGVRYSTADVVVPSADIRLSGRLYAPIDLAKYPLLVLVAGSGPESIIGDAYTVALAKAFTSSGIGVLAYDKRGTGKSEGKLTGSDFRTLGDDAAAAVRVARNLPGVTQVGVWGISQAGWVIPYTIRDDGSIRLLILVSPAGVNPSEQVNYFLHQWERSMGLSEAEADRADTMHLATAHFYATGEGYREAQATVDRFRDQPWFHRIVTHPYWDDMSREGQLYTPPELAAAVAKRPGEFELLRSPSSFMGYSELYQRFTVPTLVIYGSADALVPIDRSRAVIDGALRTLGSHTHEFKVFTGADHDLESPDHTVRADYLAYMTAWAKAQFAKGP